MSTKIKGLSELTDAQRRKLLRYENTTADLAFIGSAPKEEREIIRLRQRLAKEAVIAELLK